MGEAGKTAWLLAAAVLGVVVGCAPAGKPTDGGAAGSSASTTVDGSSRLASERAALAEQHRVKPDARFLRAFAAIDAVLGAAPGEATAEYGQGGWAIRVGSQAAGTLPDLPTFADAMSALADHAAKVAAAHPLDSARPPAAAWPVGGPLPSPEASFDSLEKLQATGASAARTTATIDQAAHALVAVIAQMPDPFQRAEALEAQAVALVAIDKGPVRGNTVALEALLAHVLGYEQAAKDLAAKLPADDIARIRIEQPRTFPLAPPYTLPVLWQQADRGSIVGRRYLTSAWPQLALLATAARAGDPQAQAMARQLETGRDTDQWPRAGAQAMAAMQATDANLLASFDAMVSKVGAASGAGGPLFDAALEQSYYRAAMGAALYRAATFALYELGAAPAARALVTRYSSGGGGFGDDYRKWVSLLASAQAEEERAKGELWAAAGVLPALGATGSLQVATILVATADYGDPRRFALGKAVFARADSRPYERAALLQLAYHGLNDMALVEHLGRSLAEYGPNESTGDAAFVLQLLGDSATLARWLHEPGLPAQTAAPLVRRLVVLGALDDRGARAELERLVSADPHTWSVAEAYADYLENRRAFADERALLHRWLDANKGDDGLGPVVAQTMLARTYGLEHDPARAWQIIQPVLSSQYSRAMGRAVFSLCALGRYDEAEAIAKARLARYPSVGSVAVLAHVYWMEGKIAEAGALVAHPSVQAPDLAWGSQIGAEMSEIFGSRPVAEGAAAFAAMKGADLFVLRAIAMDVDNRGHAELAFALSSTLSAGGMENLEFLLNSAVSLEKARGHAAMVSWLTPRVPPPLLPPLSQFAFMDSLDSLLWEVVPSPPPAATDEGSHWVWVFRAASSLRASTPHTPEIVRYYEQAAGHDKPLTIGRYLLGLVDEKTVMALGTDERSVCEIGFWLGYKAQMERRFVDASDWYHVATEVGLPQIAEYRFAWNQLYAWRKGNRALSRL